jgi:P27 family predicted phage terminase small subunit
MAGRKVIPMEIKKAKGTYQACRNRNKPEESIEKPTAPDWLNKRAKKIFKDIVQRLDELNLASATYTDIIALLASRQEELERFDKALNNDEENGYVYKTTNSYGDPILKENPIVRLREKAARHVHSLIAELGLTPSGINKVGARPEKVQKNEFDDLENIR